MSSNQKVPFVIILLVIFFVLVLVIILASYTSKSSTISKGVEGKKLSKELVSYSTQKNIPLQKNIAVSPLQLNHQSDSFLMTFDSLSPNESIIFGGNMQYSSVSVYKNDVLSYSKVFSGNQGFVVSSNLHNVNGSYFQIGKRIQIENIQYNCIKIYPEDEKIEIAVNNVSHSDFKAYKCEFQYLIREEPFIKSKSIFKSLFGISEYDLEKASQSNLKELFPTNSFERMFLTRHFDKKKRTYWTFQGIGTYALFYVKGIYSFEITDTINQIQIRENGNRDVNNGSFGYQIIQDPKIQIYNSDENIPTKNFNSDLVKLIHTPVSLYEQFVYGKKVIFVDIWNRIHNKIILWKISNL